MSDLPHLEPHALSDLVPEMTHEEYDLLLADIHEHGLHEAVCIYEDRLLDGRNRYRAICDLAARGIDVPLRTTEFHGTAAEAASYVISLNIHRRQLTVGQRSMIAVPLMRAMQEANPKGGDRRSDDFQSGNIAGLNGRESREIAAATVNVSARSVQQAATLIEEAPDLAEQVRNGHMELWQADKEQKARKKRERIARVIEEIAAEPTPLPVGRFRVIAIDPPWSYDNRAEDASHRAANPYPSMLLEDILALPIPRHSEDDCILWLWTTNAHMRDAFTVLDAWGFEHKTILTWVKDRMGLGDWLRGRTEHCLMAVRGTPVVTLTNQTTCIEGKMREHSRKPEEFYTLVESLCPGSKLEMFGREQREGWTVWGAESTKF